jgi:hypothetical protein
MTAPEMAAVEECRLRPDPEGFRVEAVVRNTTERPIFVTCDLRRIELDDARERATLWFSDAGRSDRAMGPGLVEHALPRTEALEPGERRTVEGRLPAKLKRLIVHEDETWEVEVVDLTGLRAVDVRVNVADAPFYFNPKRGGGLVDQMAAWGGVIGATARRRRGG